MSKGRSREAEANRLALKWRGRLWLGQWVVERPVFKEELEHGDGILSSGIVFAQVDYDSAYQQAAIRINGPIWNEATENRRNRQICHEMVHVRLAEIAEYVTALMDALPEEKHKAYKDWWHQVLERATENWTNVMLEASGELKGSV